MILGVFNVLGTVMTLTGISVSGSSKSMDSSLPQYPKLGIANSPTGKYSSRREDQRTISNFGFPEILSAVAPGPCLGTC
jgi:hypothetical protein